MKTREVIILILIVAAGIGLYFFQTGRLHLRWDFGEWPVFGAEEFTFEEYRTIEPPFPTKFNIRNSHGNVEIQCVDEERIGITFQKRIRRKSEEEAGKVAEKLRAVIRRDTGRIEISTNRQEFRRGGFETDFRVTLPLNMDIEVENSHGLVKVTRAGHTILSNRHGKVVVSDIGGNLVIRNSNDDVEVDNVRSSCRVESKHSTILVSAVGGELDIINRHGRIHLEDIAQKVNIESPHTEISGRNLRGPVFIRNSYERIVLEDVGPTRIEGRHSPVEVNGVEGHLNIANRYARIKLNRIMGDLAIEGRNLAVLGKTIHGHEITVSTSYDSVELTDFSGTTTVTNSHARITLEPAAITHPVEVRGSYSDIKFFWPSGARNPLEARSRSGDIKWNIEGDITFEQQNGTTVLRAFLREENLPRVEISTTYGDIRIEEQF